MRKRTIAGLVAILTLNSCSLLQTKPDHLDISHCFNLLFDAKKVAIEKDDKKTLDILSSDKWCNDYSKLDSDIDWLNDYINKNRTSHYNFVQECF